MIGSVLALAGNPVARYVAAGLAILAAVGWLRWDAASDARAAAEARFEARLAEARQEAQEAAQAALTEVERIVRRDLAEAAQRRAQVQEEADALRKELAERAAESGGCDIPADLVERLRAIR